jgi:predicted 3-demethylubiquinone-9 3-methyltransferase (glyoxalase superfamily)
MVGHGSMFAARGAHVSGDEPSRIDHPSSNHPMQFKQKISPCLWFDDQGEEAAKYYTSIFENSRITGVTHYSEAGREVHGRPPGSVMTVTFELDGNEFMALNGGPVFKFNEAVSLMVQCDDQKEIDYYWEKLGAGGDPDAQVCGWLKDKFGLSWQINWKGTEDLWRDASSPGSQRAFTAMLKMKKIDVAELQRAYRGR